MSKTPKQIKQKHYPSIDVDITENDVIQIISPERYGYNLIQIERSSLPKLIKILQGEVEKV